MTKMSTGRKVAKGVVEVKEPRGFTEEELKELQELVRVAAIEKFKASQVKANTALVPNGKEVAEQLEAVSRLVENFKDQWLGAKLQELGYPQGSQVGVDSRTGLITPR